MHDGHRDRLRRRFKEDGLGKFEEHNVLELILFYCIPRKDTNEIAHRLMKEFGSIASVFDAPIERLESIEGIGENAAIFLKLLPAVCMRYLESRGKKDENLSIPKTTKDFSQLVLPKFLGRHTEAFLVMCLDNMGRVISNEILFEGTVNAASVDTRMIMERVIHYNAASVLIAHNHPDGFALASEEDMRCTGVIFRNLRSLNVELKDHLIVAGNDVVSMKDSGVLHI